MAERVFIGLGSNLGDRESHLLGALRELGATDGVRLEAVSSAYDTTPVGEVLDQPRFLNAVCEVRVELEPGRLLDRCKEIERSHGRDREEPRHSPRPLDLDILLFGSRSHAETGLQVPHRDLAERRFVLEPLCELAPELEVPGLGPVTELLARVPPGGVERVGPLRP